MNPVTRSNAKSVTLGIFSSQGVKLYTRERDLGASELSRDQEIQDFLCRADRFTVYEPLR